MPSVTKLGRMASKKDRLQWLITHVPRGIQKSGGGRRKTWQAQKFERLRCDPNVNAKDNRADEYMYMTTLTVQDDLPELDPAPSLFHLGDEFDAVEVGMKVTFAVLSTTLQRYTAHFGSTAQIAIDG